MANNNIVEVERAKREGQRKYFVTHRGGYPYQVHILSGTCLPTIGTNVGFGDNLSSLLGQEFLACTACKPT